MTASPPAPRDPRRAALDGAVSKVAAGIIVAVIAGVAIAGCQATDLESQRVSARDSEAVSFVEQGDALLGFLAGSAGKILRVAESPPEWVISQCYGEVPDDLVVEVAGVTGRWDVVDQSEDEPPVFQTMLEAPFGGGGADESQISGIYVVELRRARTIGPGCHEWTIVVFPENLG